MFGTEYIIAFIKIFFQIAFAIVTAIPAKIAWNCVAEHYLVDYIPEQFVWLPYWHVVAIILVSMYVGEIIARVSPFRISMNNSSESKASKATEC